MEQKVPDVSDSDILRIIKRDFQQFEFSEIREILEKYQSETTKGKNRVHASILKLSNGSIELLKHCTQKAILDYRDVIVLSEYPNYSKSIFEENVSIALQEQLIIDDWIQYEAWLNK